MTVIHTTGRPPKKAYTSDAAFDLRAEQGLLIPAGKRGFIDCGFSIAIPEGYVGLVCSRSGYAKDHGLIVLNAPGIIDPGYRGKVGVILMNLGEFAFEVVPGDRIAQLLIVPAPSVQLVQSATDIGIVYPSERDQGGFGSTGAA